MVDWFTVAAQIVNFLILVALLRYFLYGRILEAIDRRRQRLQNEWDEARRLRALAEEELEGARREHEQLAHQRDELLARVRREVENYRQSRMRQVREEIEAMRQQWADTLADEREAFLRDLRREVATAVLTIARRVLQELADAELETIVVRQFLQRLREAATTLRKRWREVAETEEPPPVLVRTAFPLPPALQNEVEDGIRNVLDGNVTIEWETSPDLLCGITLHTDDEKVAWDFRDELDAIEHEVVQTIEEEIRSHQPEATQEETSREEAKR